MKKYLLLMFLIVFTGCSRQFIQLIETSSNNTNNRNGSWVFENDTIKITYNFWAEHGLMAFTIYNKLDKPIYINWKNSSYILEDNKLDYWIDEQETNATSYYKGYYYNDKIFGANQGKVVSASNSVKPEMITFIPPKSNYVNSKMFHLTLKAYYFLMPNRKEIVEKRNDKPKKNTTVYIQTYDENNSPFKFRNFIAMSFNENSSNYMFIDNGFYISSIKEMDSRHFEGKITGWNQGSAYDNYIQTPIYEYPFKRGNSYFIYKKLQSNTSSGIF